jgi:hypothetical protein
MPSEIVILDSEVVGFSAQAVSDLEASVTAYKTDLLKEIGRIEAGQNPGSGTPEITSRMVKEAETIFSRGSIYQRRKNSSKFLKTISVISLFISGAMVQKDLLSEFAYLILFLSVASIAIFTNILVHMRD